MSTTLSHIPLLKIDSTIASPVWKFPYFVAECLPTCLVTVTLSSQGGTSDVYFDLKLNSKCIKNYSVQIIKASDQTYQTLTWTFPIYLKPNVCRCQRSKHFIHLDLIASVDSLSVDLKDVLIQITIKKNE